MDEDGLRKVSPWEMGLLADAAQGLTYRQIAYKRGKKVKTVERAFERLREKLRAHGGGRKSGLVHWYDTHYAVWRSLIESETGLDAEGQW